MHATKIRDYFKLYNIEDTVSCGLMAACLFQPKIAGACPTGKFRAQNLVLEI